jgi:hypothetical protein
MLQVASAAGDSMPSLFLEAHDNDATPQLVSSQPGTARLPLCACLSAHMLLLTVRPPVRPLQGAPHSLQLLAR